MYNQINENDLFNQNDYYFNLENDLQMHNKSSNYEFEKLDNIFIESIHESTKKNVKI
jgi:hypothetical protein